MVLASALIFGACSYTASSPADQAAANGSGPNLPALFGAGGAPKKRDVPEMMRAKFEPRACEENGDCPFGMHCNDDDTCDYECVSDDGCGPGLACNDQGQCAMSFQRFISTSAPSCAGETRAQIIQDLEDLAVADEGTKCHVDSDCICGAYCNSESGFCQVDCVVGSTSGNLVCSDPDLPMCNDVGRCIASTDPGPTPQLTLDLSPGVVSGDTYSAPAVVSVTVAVDAVSADVLRSPHPAPVSYHFVGINDPRLPPADPSAPPPDPATLPQVKCATGDAFATSCTIDGGWTFDVPNHNLHSAEKTIWVQLPQTTTHQTWTLQATSQWATDPFSITVSADPVVPAPPVAGHYKGVLTLTSGGGPLATPVEALISSTGVAVLEPNGALLPDGHAVFSLDAGKVTMLGWLKSGTGATASHYDVLIKLGALVQNHATGHVDFSNGTLAFGETAPLPLSLSLDRTGDLDAPACTGANDCTTNGTYCDTSFGRCLAGAGPATGAGIVDAASAAPSVTIPSTQVASWASSVASLAGQHPGALQPGIQGIESAYCAHNSGDLAAPKFGITTKIAGSLGDDGSVANSDGASLDRECNSNGMDNGDYLQPTFPFADRTTEFTKGAQGGADFALVDTCSNELGASPSAGLSTATCVSPGRFFLALAANVANGAGVPGGDVQQRLVWQILRQWLGLNAYVASTQVRVQPYHDVVDAVSVSRAKSLSDAVDQMEQGLLVLLDPTVRAQFAEGSSLRTVATAPDYRLKPRPVARWTFNNVTPANVPAGGTVSVPDAEGSNALNVSWSGGANGGVSLGGNLVSWGFDGTRTCQTSAPVALALTDRAFSITAALLYVPHNGQIVTLVDKLAPSGQRLWLDATTSDYGAHVDLTLNDSNGGAAHFSIPWEPNNWSVSRSFIAIVAEEGNYRAYVDNPVTGTSTVLATGVTNGGPRWGDAGTVQLACQPSGAAYCQSIDRIWPGDKLDIQSQTDSYGSSPVFNYTCHTLNRQTSCTGTPASSNALSYCNNFAASAQSNLRTSEVNMGIPAALANQTMVSATVQIVDQGSESEGPGESFFWTDWNCNVTETFKLFGSTGYKPICGPGGIYAQWDEISLWSHAITLGEFSAMVGKYNYTYTNESTPPKPTATLKGDEQRAGLAVYLLEAANAHLDLVAHYLIADGDEIYSTCYNGSTSTERPIALARAGRNLRLAEIVQGEAARLAALADPSATWLPRYQADLQQFAAKQAALVAQLGFVADCKNSLDISDADIPLYVGQAANTSPTARFYAASDYLVGLAEQETLSGHGTAAMLESQARTDYIAQRQSSFQTNRGTGSTEAQDRITALTVNYEDQLKRYCGAAPGDLVTGGHPLLDGFRSGTITAANCYLKLEDTAHCTNDLKGHPLSGSTPPADIDDKCVRGEMGERIIAIKSAAIDADNANAAWDRASKAWDDQDSYCYKVADSASGAQTDLAKHNKTMRALQAAKESAAILGSISKSIAGVKSALTGGTGLPGVIGAIGEGTAGIAEAIADEKMQTANEDYAAEVLARQGSDAVAACHHAADQQRFSIGAAFDQTKRAAEASVAAGFGLNDDINTVAAIGAEANSQFALEATINRTPPEFHYWLDQTIADYERHMANARRLTYLALRAYEYEVQFDTGKRAQVLSARLPEDLENNVLSYIKNHSAPLAGGGVDTKAFSHTFSLRDEILQLQPVLDPDHPDGPPKKTSIQVFNDLLMTHPIFSGTGANRHLAGYGIPFSIHQGDSWTVALCDERIWRITPLVTVDGGLPSDTTVFLQESNTFGSQTCTADHPVNMTRVRQNVNLLAGDQVSNFQTPDSAFKTPIIVDLGGSNDLLVLKTLVDTDTRLDPSMAGRGVYGDYILEIPLCDPARGCTNGYTAAKMAKVTDVNIRFDVSGGANPFTQ